MKKFFSDKNTVAVFVGALMAMIVSCIALHNSSSRSGQCAVTYSSGKEVHVLVGTWE